MIYELLHELQGVVYFSNLYLHSIYHQIRIREEEIQKTTYITCDGRYDFLVMHF
jgi:hypothetical protein